MKLISWPEYNKNLVERGSVKLWLPEDLESIWYDNDRRSGKGSKRVYSDEAIEICLLIRCVFSLALRQCKGFVRSLFKERGLKLSVPDYSTLCRRQSELEICIREGEVADEIEVAVDATGFKISGEGEWKVRTHKADKRRAWKKLHAGIDTATGLIVTAISTGSDTADTEVFIEMLEEVPETIVKAYADGAYDSQSTYEYCEVKTIHPVIPPPENAVFHGRSGPGYVRDLNVVEIAQIGRKTWKVKQNYHQRSLVESLFSALKRVFGDRIPSRVSDNQDRDLFLRCKAWNRMRSLSICGQE